MIHGTFAHLFYAVVALVAYLFTAYCIREIARKRACAHPWFAWVPILQVYLFCRLSIRRTGFAVLWTVLCLLPLINFIFIAILSVRLARVLHRNRWYGLLLLVPPISFIVQWDLAFGIKRQWQAAAA